MEPQLDLMPAAELLSARDIATLLKITPRAVRLRMSGAAPVLADGIQKWPLDILPIDYQEQLRFVHKKSGLWSLADVLEQATPRWVPDFKLSELPAYSQGKAFKVRAVMLVYFAALDEGKLVHEAESAARSAWLQEFAEACSAKTIARWAAKTEERGGVEWARIEAYADRKSCPHVNARLENRKKRPVPAELIRAFKSLCVQPGANIASAFRKLEMDWQVGREVAGIGAMTEPRQPFPFKITQLRKFAPSDAARKLGNRGKAAARRDAIEHMVRTHENLRPCELYVMDDTRINVTMISDLTGLPVELNCYIAMEVASRAIVGYILREGKMLASDVDALMARVLRTSGLADPYAGYKTRFLFERGTVACSPERQQFLELMFPGQIEIKRTSMDGGQNFPGDFVQKNSGHWMGKGVIESFMRTLGNITLHIAGQRGSVYVKTPAVTGDPAKPHVGGIVDEAVKAAQAARALALYNSDGVSDSMPAGEAIDAAGIKLPLLRVSQFRQAFAQAIEHYNSVTGHRREGFRLIGREKANGGLEYVAESSNERWTWLVHQAQQRGKAPQRIAPIDAVMLLHKARKVTMTKQGAEITVEKVKYRYTHPDSIAKLEAGRLTGSKKEYLALHDPEDLSLIYILQNPLSALDGDRLSEPARFLECLELREKADITDPAALAEHAEYTRRHANRVSYELASAAAPALADLTENRDRNSKLVGVVTTRGEYHEVGSVSALCRAMKHTKPKPSPSRHEATPAAVDELKNALKGDA